MPERVLRLNYAERLPKSLLVGALVLGLVVAFLVANVAQAQITLLGISYAVDAGDQFLTLCTGQSEKISVSIAKRIFPNVDPLSPGGGGIAFMSHPLRGGSVRGVVAKPDVGHFEPAQAERGVVGWVEPRADYTFVADAPGVTTIEFRIVRTGDEAFEAGLGVRIPRTHYIVEVEVVDCYEASTSGLGIEFAADGKDLGALDDPFLISGVTDLGGISGSSENMFFIPNRRDRLRGAQVFIETYTIALGGSTTNCFLVFSGRYEVAFHITPGDPAFRPGVDVGNLVLYGNGSQFCEGRFVQKVKYTTTPGFLIAFTPKPPSTNVP
jgi:hypothetical protein